MKYSLIIALCAFILAACGTPAPSSNTSPASAPAEASVAAVASAAAETSTDSAAFPVTIEHKYGSVTIPAAPTRVVSVGFIDQDAILALGVVPVGIRDWYGDQPNATWPWAQDKLGGATPAVLPANALNFEQISSLNPDLIIGISSGMTEQEYATLSQIAPTVAQSGEYIDYGVPWQEGTRVIGRALGRAEQAEALVADVEAQFAAAREQNAAFNDASGLVAASFNNEYSAYGPQDVRGRLMESLGFQTPEEIASLAGETFYTSISRERLDLLDTDVLVWVVSTDAEQQAIQNDALYQQLNVAKQGRAVFLDQELSGAASFSSVLSLPFLLDRFVPQLAAAVDGDPATDATTSTAATPEAMEGSPAANGGALTVIEETEQDRLIQHRLGEARVPRQPQRIVTLQDQNALLPLLELGVQNVIGSVGYTPEAGGPVFRRTELYDTSNIQYVGEIGEPNLEAIAALQPDLIVGGQYEITEENYELLAAIAPTVVVEQFTRPVWDVVDDLALLTNTQQAAADLKARYDQRVEEVRTKLGDPGAITISIITPYNAEFYFDASPYDNGVAVARDLGLRVPTLHEQAIAQGDFPMYSMELLPQADGDVLFILDYSSEGQSTEYSPTNIQNSALFNTLNAVQKDQAYVIDPSRMGGVSYGGLFGILDAVEEHLTAKPLDTSWEQQ